MKSGIAIKVEGLGKCYQIGQAKSGDFRQSFGSWIDKLRGRSNGQVAESKEFWALKDINFEIKKGEAVGIIGRNGAGKSTLLKILSRITEPTKGRFEINGRVSSLLEVGTGFHPELSGRENIYLNGTILGMKRQEIKAKFDEILAFSGVEKFIDTPVKHYSSGMKVRLAFSVAAHLEPEILIIDEVLAVGDAEFQKKCLGKMDEVSKNEGRTVLFVSHNMGAVESLCEKGILLDSGKTIKKDHISKVVELYFNKQAKELFYIASNDKKNTFIKSVQIVNSTNKSASIYYSNQSIIFKIETYCFEALSRVTVGVAIRDKKGNKITTIIKNHKEIGKGKMQHVLEILPNTFLAGNFTLDIAFFIQDGPILEYLTSECPFQVIDSSTELFKYSGSDIGSLQLNAIWK